MKQKEITLTGRNLLLQRDAVEKKFFLTEKHLQFKKFFYLLVIG